MTMNNVDGKPRVLVVDDEPDIVELISFNLRNAGFVVETAASGVEAIEKASRMAPSLIVLDLMLPELDGTSVCEILRITALTARIPILMLTGWASEQARVIGLESGASDYMIKTFSPRELIVLIRKILQINTPVAG